MFKNIYEIRIESIGGFGANLVGKMLGELGAIYLNLEAQSFASYGSEKRGSPVKSYIRYSKNEIRINAPIKEPDLLAIFKLDLIEKENVLAGIKKDCSVVINSSLSFDEIVEKGKIPSCNLYVIDGLKIAIENKARLNIVMFGAILKAMGFVDIKDGEKVIKDVVGKKYPKSLESNLKAFKTGFESVKLYKIENENCVREYKELRGYVNCEIGGVNSSFGNSITNDLQGCREGFLPKYIREKCIDCGFCDSTCPDMVFQFKNGVNLGMDLYHCKGCLRCVEICPTNAHVEAKEGESYDNIGNIYLLNKDFDFDKVGESGWIDSESYNNN